MSVSGRMEGSLVSRRPGRGRHQGHSDQQEGSVQGTSRFLLRAGGQVRRTPCLILCLICKAGCEKVSSYCRVDRRLRRVRSH